MEQTVKEGQLCKRGKINTDFKLRHFILNGKQIAYFKGSNHTPSGTIELKEVRKVYLHQENIFIIETPSRNYEIKGETKEISQSWVDAITQCLKSRNS